jgi:alpha-mannosidase
MSAITRRNLLEALAALPAAAAAREAGALEEVIVVYKTHFDIGYTSLARDVINMYRTTMIDKALAVVDRNRALPPEQRFVWTLPGWPMAQILYPGQDPERKRRVLAAYREGYFVTHALPFTTETEMLDLETVVRGMEFSSRLARENGKPLPRDAKMTDVPSHAWAIPTILTHAGVEFLHLGCNAGSTGPDLPMLFWWEGPDGSRLLTFYSRNYGSQLAPPSGWPHRVWLALIHSGDNDGPPTPEAVQQLRDAAQEKLPGVKVRLGRLSDFADAVRATPLDIPVIRADMPDTWIYGLMSMPQETKMGENLRPRLQALEALTTQLGAWGVRRSPLDIASAYENSLLYGEHTWGIDFKKFGTRLYGGEWNKEYAAGKYKLAEESWAEHGAYNRKAEAIVAPGMAAATAALAAAVNVQGQRTVVYNPLAWTRSDVVEIPEHKIRFVAHDVPPMGYRSFTNIPVAEALQIDEGAGKISNGIFLVKIDPARGALASIVEMASGRELIDAGQTFGFGQYFREMYSSEDVNAFAKAYLDTKQWWPVQDMARKDLPPVPHRIQKSRDLKPTFRRDGASVTAVLNHDASEDMHAYSLAVTLYPELPWVELTWTAGDKPKDPWPEAGWLALPFRVTQPVFRLGRLGGIVDPAKDVVRGANHEMYKLTNGMAIHEPAGRGIGLCSVDSPVVSLEHTGGYRYSKDFVPSKPVVFVNLYNNLFGVNFQQWSGGSWSSRIRIWAFDLFSASTSLIGPAKEARSPLEAAYFDGSAGELAASHRGLELSRSHVDVTAFGPNPDGEGKILRLWEQAGESGPCQVRLPEQMRVTTAHPCDLRGRPTAAAIPVTNGTWTVELKRNAPASFILL